MSQCSLLKARQEVSFILQNKFASNAYGLQTAVPKWSLELLNTTSNCHRVPFWSVHIVASTLSANRQTDCNMLADFWLIQFKSTAGNLLKHSTMGSHWFLFFLLTWSTPPTHTHTTHTEFGEYPPNNEVKTWITKAIGIPILTTQLSYKSPSLSLTSPRSSSFIAHIF